MNFEDFKKYLESGYDIKIIISHRKPDIHDLARAAEEQSRARIPSARSTSCEKKIKKVTKSRRFNEKEVAMLTELYQKNPHPDAATYKVYAAEISKLGIKRSNHSVRSWFYARNHRN